MTVQVGAVWGAPGGKPRGTFAGLADQLGPEFTERDCQVAALSGRLPELVRLAERRSRRTLPGWEALALVEERIRRENLHRLHLLLLKARSWV